jgi:hypothetical protein
MVEFVAGLLERASRTAGHSLGTLEVSDEARFDRGGAADGLW